MKAVLLAALVALATPSDKAACHRQCVSCKVQCKHSENPTSCQQTCLQLKAQCCQTCGAGPGPRKTCSCT